MTRRQARATTGGRRRQRKRRSGKRPRRDALGGAAHHQADAGPDQVVCLLCGEVYRAVRASHLRARHGFEGEHPVRDYKQRFGLRVAACEETCALIRRARIRKVRSENRHWTKRRLREEVRRRQRAGLSLAHSQVPVALSLAARRLVGEWDAALQYAGLDPADHRILRRWDEDTLVAEIQRLSEKIRPLSDRRARVEYPALHRAAFRLAGSWGAALRLAGLDPEAHREPRMWTVERGVEWVRQRHARGEAITAKKTPSGLLACISKKTGLTWTAFVESLGIPYPGPRRRLDWTDAAVIAAIRRRRRRGLPLHITAVKADGQALTHQARNRFGSWDAALRAAGMEPERIRRSRTWTRAEVIEEIRKRRAAGKPMSFRAVRQDDRRLVKAAQTLFPSSWARALAAAGLDPALCRGGAAASTKRRHRKVRRT